MDNYPTRAAGSPRGVLAAVWRAGGLVYLAVCILALLVGLFPHSIYPPRGVHAAPLPVLQALTLGQAMFILVGWPVLCIWRTQHRTIGKYAAESIVESVAWLIFTAPLYLAAAWLADATAIDVARSVLVLLTLWPLAWAAGALMRAAPSLIPAVIIATLVVSAMPAVWYIWREFLGTMPAGWIWDLGPATYIWQAAASRTGNLLPSPAWPPVAWLATAAAMWTLGLLAGGKRQPTDNDNR